MNAHTRKPSENLPVPSGKGPSDKAPSGKGRELTARPPLPPAIAEFNPMPSSSKNARRPELRA